MVHLYRDRNAPPAPSAYFVTHSAAVADVLLGAGTDVWSAASAISWGPVRYATAFRAVWTETGLALRFDAVDDAPWHTMERRDDTLWEEEVVEIFLDPAGTARDYYELEINPANVVCDLRVERAWPDLFSDRLWSLRGLETRVVPLAGRRGDVAGWTATAFLPWDGFAALLPAAGSGGSSPPRDRWRFNVFRIKRPGGAREPERDVVYAAWSVPDAPSFHDPRAFRDFVFVDRSPHRAAGGGRMISP